MIGNPSNLSLPSILISVLTFIGSLSGLEAIVLIGSFVLSVFVGVSAIRRNKAQTNYYEKAMRDETP